MSDSTFDYTPPPSLRPFFLSDARVRFVRGPIGSTKSTAMVMELFRRACEHPPDADGIRRTKFAIVRNTQAQITETCLVTIMKCLRPLIRHKVQAHKLVLEFNDVYSEWLMMPIDTPENTNKVLSLELTGAWISEAREIDPAIAGDVFSRCGRFTAVKAAKGAWYGLILESNSFSEDSLWFDKLEVNLPDKWEYFVQPGARDPRADWLQYLVPSYYEDLISTNTPAWIESYIDNKITPSLAGQAVFLETFDTKVHVVDRLTVDLSAPLVIGIDTGRHPAVVVGQTDPRGRLLVLASAFATNMGLEKFLGTVVRPMLTRGFPGARVFLAMDPAGNQRSQITEESSEQAAKRVGFTTVLAPTNNIAPGSVRSSGILG